MKKLMVVGIIILLVGMSVPSTAATLNDDVKITISAGFLRQKWGKVGIGLCIEVINKIYNNLSGICIIEYYKISGEFIRKLEVKFELSSNTVFGYSYFNLFDSAKINRLAIKVSVDNTTAIRSGIEIGPFVILEK